MFNLKTRKEQIVKYFQVFLVIFPLFFLVFPIYSGASDVCRNYAFEGMETNKERALSILPSVNTHELKNSSIYIEYDNGIIYYQSNFINEGFENPTKVKGDPNKNPLFSDVSRIFKSIAFTEMPTDAAYADALKVLHEDIQVFLDVSVFNDAGVPKVDLTGIKNIKIVDTRTKQSLITGSPELMTTLEPPPSIISKIKDYCCLFSRPPHWADRISKFLSQSSINTKKIKIASFFMDTLTVKELHKSKLKTKKSATDIKNDADLKALFDSERGNTLLLLGHTEDLDYVIRTNGKKEQYRIPISKLRLMAKDSGVSLIDIGCVTVQKIKEESFGFGVMTEYSPHKAMKSIKYALKVSKNYEDFLVNISSEGLKVVLDPSFINSETKTATIYTKIRDASKSIWIKVAEITFSPFK